VPAAFNQVLGLKPTRGLLSCRGVVPAVRSLDCVSIFAPTAEDAAAVLAAGAAFDPADPFSRRAAAACAPDAPLRFGVFADLASAVGADAEAVRLTGLAAARLEAMGAHGRAVDPTPFLEAAALLYGGPWVAERYAAVGEFLEDARADADPTVRAIILGAKTRSAVEQHRASYRLAELRRRADTAFADVDVLLLPTAPTIPTLAAVAADPVGANEALGRTNNFANLFDLAAVAVPAGLRDDGLPAGVTLFAPAFAEPWLVPLAGALHRASGVPWGATGVPLSDPPASATPPGRIPLAVVGAHLRGQPLHGQLEALGARFVWEGTTAPHYRLYALANTSPPKPGLVRDPDGGAAIRIEVWSLTPEAFGRFVAAVPAPLCIGTVELADGRSVHGFLCEPAALRGAREITSFGGWVSYSSRGQTPT
jgi:allophanate hydrolase